MALEVDCAIAGGGPTGALLATLLAQRGLRVALCDAGSERTWPEETLLPSARRALAEADLDAVLESVGRADRARQGAIWGSDALAWRADEAEPGWRLPRPAFERSLRARAAHAGVVVLEAHTVQGPLPVAAGAARAIGTDGASVELRAELWAVACGRTFPAALVARECVAEAAPTAALHLRGALDPRFADGNLIEAVAAGWWWYLPLADGTASLTLLADVGELQARGAKELVAAALAQARGPACTVRDPAVRDAVRATARVQRADGVFLVGDAAAALDPLASQGVEKALAAAQSAARAIATALREPRLREAAHRHHAAWELSVWRAHAAVAADFYRRERRFPDAAFWRARHTPEPPPPEPLPARVQRRPDAVAALGLVPQGDHLAEAPGVARPDGEVVTHFGRVPAAALLAAFASPVDPAAGAAAAARDPSIYVLPPRLVHAAIEAAWRDGWLVRAGG